LTTATDNTATVTATSYNFNGPGAATWAMQNYGRASDTKPTIPNYKFYGSDCTNFVSTAWARGGKVPQNTTWHGEGAIDRVLIDGSHAFIRVKDFRSYW